MNFNELTKHKKVGLDVDLTLINGYFSNQLKTWVENHFDKKEFHLITFRDHQGMEKLNDDLTTNGYSLEWFQGCHSIPQHYAQRYHKYRDCIRLFKSNNERKYLRSLVYHNTTHQDVSVARQDALYWKARVCHTNGLTALVDDLPHMVEEGCQHFGIHYFNSSKGGKYV